MVQRRAVVALLLLAACGSSTPSPTPLAGTAIPTTVSGPLGTNLAGLQNLSGTSALAAQTAALALQAGVQASQVSLTASENAVPSPNGGASDGLRHSGAASVGGFANAYAFQLTILNQPTTGPLSGPNVYSGVFAYEDVGDFVLVQGPFSAANAATEVQLPPAIGLIEVSGQDGGLWVGSAGQELAEIDPTSVASPCTNPCKNVPSFITSCCKANFTSAGFSITASMLFSGGAGSRLVALPNGLLPGVALTLDCNQSTLCGTGTSTSIAVSVTPSTETVPAGDTEQFYANVTGTTNTSVTWSVEEGNAGGTVTQGGLYTAPGTPGGPYHVVATSVVSPNPSGFAVVTVGPASSGPGLLQYWTGTYVITLTGGSTVTGTDTFSFNQQADGGLYFGFLCPPATLDATEDTSGTVLTIVPSTCSQPSTTSATCPGAGATFSLAGGTGTLSGDALSMSFDGGANGVFGTPCTGTNTFTGTFSGTPYGQ